MTKRITSIEVARRAGVSQSTVSRVFSTNSPNVAEATRQRVIAAAQELGYRPNAIGRMMSTQQTNTIGIVMANITSPFYPYVLEKFLQGLQAIGRRVLLFTASAHQDIDDILPLILEHQVDALIVTSATLSSAMAAECQRAGTPVILFNRRVENASVSAVCCDNERGGREIASLLIETGHQHFAYIAGTANTSTNRDRQRGFVTQLQAYGIDDVRIEPAEYSYDASYRATTHLLQSDHAPDAIFCANDIMAMGAIDAARACGLCVPDDVSIVGFDDIPMARWGAYQLTTMSQEVDTMIEKTIDLMLTKIAAPQSDPVTAFVAGRMQIRASVRGVNTPAPRF